MQVIRAKHPGMWNRFVTGHPDTAYTFLYQWRRVIEKTYGHKSIYLAAVGKNDDIRAVLPLFRIKRPFCSPQWVSIPFFDQAGILGDVDAGKHLLKKAGTLLNAKGGNSLSLRQDHRFDAAGMQIEGHSPRVFTEKVSLHIPLASSRQKMMTQFRSKLRSQIKKGMKNGLTWDIGKEKLIDPFYRVFSRNMRDLGSPVHSKHFFRHIFLSFPANAFICVVYHRGTPAAAAFMFRFKNRLANPWASSLQEYRHLNTNMVLYWQMIGFACNLGLEQFDMGRSSKGAATYRFKKQWGPRETPLRWYTWGFGEKKAVKETLSIAPWKALPMWGANLAGPVIRKHISL